MADIIKSVTQAFAKTRDARIDYHIVEKGSASLLTGIYDQVDPATQGFYRKPDITGDGETTKLGVIYGEVMITPFVIDAGVESSTNDAGSILKTYRFITGEGENSGVPIGPNGTPLENVYIRDENGIPQPVVDSDGRPTLSNVILASALGSAITSLPKIWDAIKGSTPATAKTGSVDPVTGKAIPSAEQQAANAIAAKIPLGQLTDVNDAGKGDNFVLTYDARAGMWVAKPFNTAVAGALGNTTVTGGGGGAGGNGGAGGAGGAGGDAGGVTPSPDPTCYPETSYVEYPCNPPPGKSKFGMIRLPTLANTADNEYTQEISVLGTRGIELHFMANGCGRKAIWKVAAGAAESCPVGSDTACFVDPNKDTVEKPATPAAEVPYWDPASFSIKICLTTNICGSEYLIYRNTFTETALSKTSYTFTAPVINLADTMIAELLTRYPGQVFNTYNPNVKLYLSRVDECGSEYDLFFEGYKKFSGDEFFQIKTAPITAVPGTNTPQPTPVAVKADDGKFPDYIPGGGGFSAPSCPDPQPIPGTAGQPGEPGSPGTSGGTGTPGSSGTIAVEPAPVPPTISLVAPCARQYGTQTVPPGFDAIQLPAAQISSGIVDDTVEVFYEIIVGAGDFSFADPLPGTVSSTIDANTLSLIGPVADVQTATGLILLIPDDNSQGEIHYTVVITNSEGTNAGTSCMLVPEQIVIKDSQGAVSRVCIDPISTGGTGRVLVTYNGRTNELTPGFVAYNTSPEITAVAIAGAITANVAFQNALPPTDPAWLPAFTAVASGAEVVITAPAAGGSDFNGAELSTQSTAGFVFGNCPSTFLGGVTKTINDFLKINPDWNKISDVLLGIGGNVLGAVALNMIMGDVGEEQLSLPADREVDVVFLYRGRVIQVPDEYNATARTGHPASRAAWSGVWKTEWTQNPAWIVYDFITNKKYGLGSDIQLTAAQQQNLLDDIFEIGYYCDQPVADINGVMQPRFSTNTVITDGTKLQILQQLCSVFSGAALFHNGGLRVVYDHLDTEVKLLVNQATAGNFEKVLTSSKNFVNKVRLTYVEPANFYTEEVVVAENTAAIDIYGERVADVVAFGCTNASQAVRYATWILNTENKNSVNISYTAGLDHYNLIPGDIVEFYDSNERGRRRAGRIASQTGANVVLDAPVLAVAGDHFSLTLADGTIHATTIASITGVNVVLTAAPPTPAAQSAAFIAADAGVGRKLYKVIKIDETSNSKFNISLQAYSVDKY